MTYSPLSVRGLSDAVNASAPQPFLAAAAMHEFYAAADADGASQTGLALAMVQTVACPAVLWVRQAFLDRELGAPSPAGLAEMGLDPNHMVLVRARDAPSALQAALEGARCRALGAVVIELWGEHRALDLTASRRLVFAAKASGVRILLLRVAATPQPSAAETRWQMRSVPSRALPANAPGHASFNLTLLRSRIGLDGKQYHLEWDRDARSFVISSFAAGAAASEAPAPEAGGPPLSGAVVPVSFNRPGGAEHTIRLRTG